MGVTIRDATEDDAEAMLAIYAPVVRDTAISFEIEPPSADEFRGRVRTILAAHPALVAVEGAAVAGYAYASVWRARPAYSRTAETTVYVAADARGRGVGRALMTDLLGRLRARGFHRAVAGVTLPNPASVALHERLGFRPVGVFRECGRKFGRWHDVGWWDRGLDGLRPSS